MIRSRQHGLTPIILFLVFFMAFSAGCGILTGGEDAPDDPPASEPTEPAEEGQDPDAPSIGDGDWCAFGDLWAMMDRFSQVEWHISTDPDGDEAPMIFGWRFEGSESVQGQDTMKSVIYDEYGNETTLWLGEERGDYVKVHMHGEDFTGEMAEMFGPSAIMGPLGHLAWVEQDGLFKSLTGLSGGWHVDWEITSEGREQVGDRQYPVTRISLTPEDWAGLKELDMNTAVADFDGCLMIVEWTLYVMDSEDDEDYSQFKVVKIVEQ